ncbi:MAG TPA: FHA domain-containing protein [Gemmatimonadaceae bacterium]|jgi:pSer/pThr/pTyr-binding forkhead associated (FHA) protein|nr:FHA domain-containing protein [Gemmatimonadaceae bacterium]
MPVIKINDQQYSLRPGPNRVGAGTDVDVRVDENPALGVQAIVDVTNDSKAVIRRAGNGAAIRVNGVLLVEPTPLIHGDKVEIAGQELLFADDSKAGATQFISATDVAAMAQKRTGPPRATAATGGRLVSLVDGKEYAIPPSGIEIGRDAASDVVVAQNDVSRKHAEIRPVEAGYEVRDFSSNGVFVNGSRVDTALVLSRSDVIRIGSEEFRFYADVANPTPMRAAPPVPGAAAGGAVPAASPPSAPAVPSASVDSPRTVEAPAPAKSTAPVLAVLEVTNAGPSKGTEYEIHVPLAHVGRGAHNDIVIADDSVSETHAKIQRREDGWFLVDVGSTNGTYVGGQRIVSERRLDGEPDVRFGGVKMTFHPKDERTVANKGTRAIASVDRSRLATVPAPQQTASVAEPEPRTKLPGWVWGVVVLAIAAAAAFFLLNR